jgi:ubiquitin-conjugating enzyme E2 I
MTIGGVIFIMFIHFVLNVFGAVSLTGKFQTALFHPNIFQSGGVCLSILDEGRDWKPSIAVRQVSRRSFSLSTVTPLEPMVRKYFLCFQILMGIQDLLDNPNVESPAQTEPNILYM